MLSANGRLRLAGFAAETVSATTLRRPAILQELHWRPVKNHSAEPAGSDPVQEALLWFYNGELARVVVSDDRYRVEGMTADDMVDGIPFSSIYGETSAVVARWEDADNSWNLVRTEGGASFSITPLAAFGHSAPAGSA